MLENGPRNHHTSTFVLKMSHLLNQTEAATELITPMCILQGKQSTE